jgi:hypothetical protein
MSELLRTCSSKFIVPRLISTDGIAMISVSAEASTS